MCLCYGLGFIHNSVQFFAVLGRGVQSQAVVQPDSMLSLVHLEKLVKLAYFGCMITSIINRSSLG